MAFDRRRTTFGLIEVRFAAGSHICRAGDPGGYAYFVRDGRVESRTSAERAMSLSRGAWFGRVTPRKATVTALTRVVIYAADLRELPTAPRRSRRFL